MSADIYSESLDGTNGADITTGALNGYATAIIHSAGTTNTAKFTTSAPAEGTAQAEFITGTDTTTAGTIALEHSDSVSTRTAQYYSYVFTPITVGGTGFVIHKVGPSSGSTAFFVKVNSDFSVRIQNNSGVKIGNDTPALPSGEKSRIDVSLVGSTVTLNVYSGNAHYADPVGTATGSYVQSGTTTPGTNPFRYESLGINTSTVSKVRIDSFQVSSTAFVGVPGSGSTTVTPTTVQAVASVPSPTLSVTSTNGQAVKVQDWTQKTSGTVQVSSIVTTAFGSTPTSGNTLFMAVVSENPVSTPSGWSVAQSSTTGSVAVYLFYKTAGGAESTSWTVTPTAASAITVSTAEYSGFVASPLDGTNSATASGATQGTGTVSPTGAYGLRIAVLGIIGTSPTGWNNPTGSFTEQDDEHTTRTSNNNVGMAVETLRQGNNSPSSTTAVSTGTVTGGAGVIAAFKSNLGNASITAVTVQATATVPAPTVIVPSNVTVTPPTVQAVASAPAPTIHVPAFTLVTPATVQAVASVNSVTSSVVIVSVVKPDTVQATTTAPAPTVLGAAVPVTTVLPATVQATASVPSPTVTLGTSATVVAQTVQAVASVGAPTIGIGVAVTVTVSTVQAVARIATPSPIVANDIVVDLTGLTVTATVTVGSVVVTTAVSLQQEYMFSPPTIAQVVIISGALRETLEVGISLLRFGTSYQVIQSPTAEECAAADEVYLGGHQYRVDYATAQDLTTAGYGDLLQAVAS